jgi:hypothetical protein
MRQVLRLLGLRAAGGNYRGLHEACARLGIQAPRFAFPSTPPRGRRFVRVADELVFCKDSTFLNRGSIKLRLIERGTPECCAICGLGPEWNGRLLALHLDHVNGVFNDNRLENLRLLCPNCHSQTDTFAGRRHQQTRTQIAHCPHCSLAVPRRAKKCPSCLRWLGKSILPPLRPEKITWPDDDALAAMVRATSLLATGRTLGVSDNAVRKRLRNRGLLAA